jgi:hypothetical protein
MGSRETRGCGQGCEADLMSTFEIIGSMAVAKQSPCRGEGISKRRQFMSTSRSDEEYGKNHMDFRERERISITRTRNSTFNRYWYTTALLSIYHYYTAPTDFFDRQCVRESARRRNQSFTAARVHARSLANRNRFRSLSPSSGLSTVV